MEQSSRWVFNVWLSFVRLLWGVRKPDASGLLSWFLSLVSRSYLSHADTLTRRWPLSNTGIFLVARVRDFYYSGFESCFNHLSGHSGISRRFLLYPFECHQLFALCSFEFGMRRRLSEYRLPYIHSSCADDSDRQRYTDTLSCTIVSQRQ
jgi:hypothetical protein